MAEDEFYVEDETPEQVRAAISRGQKGITAGNKDLEERDKSVVDRAVARLEGKSESPRLHVVSVGTGAGAPIERDLRAPAPTVDRTETEKISISV